MPRTMNKTVFRRSLISSITAASLCAGANSYAMPQEAPIVQPGAPGSQSRTISADEAIKIANTSYTKDDVMFMQNMIPHHQQAVEMGVLVRERTNNEAILDIAGRIEKSQQDEIDFMKSWLEERGESSMQAHAMQMNHQKMGMASPQEMLALSNAKGSEFDRLFLSLMIPHHEGAVTMVKELLDKAGSAYDPVLYDFVNDIVNDQQAEIKRMNTLLAGLSSDPRVDLAAGLRDAGEAANNLKLLVSLPRPKGFFDPANPSNLPPKIENKEEAQEGEDKNEDLEQSDSLTRAADDGDAKTEWGERWPLLSFWNTDMAFAGNILVAGNYHGFNIYTLDEQGLPNLTSSVVCPGGQGDVSIVDDLLIMSVEQTRGRIDCGLEGISEDISDERFRGLRIFDISDLKRPVQVGLVQTCRGSHTHSVVSADEERIVVYNSGTAGVREEAELEGCVGEVPGDERTALFRIDVIEIPVKDPSKAKITSSPGVFADEEGRLAGLWLGGDHGEKTQDTRRTDQCHDITVFPEAKLAAGACSGNGIILDISDPLHPKRIDEVTDPGFAYWHSATFNNDGTKVLFTDEWGGGTQPRCRASDPKTWGANAIYSIVEGKLSFESYYKIDAPQSEQENCVAHNGSIVPVPGRDIFAQAWYQGGLSLMDFSDTDQPKEIAFFDRGPIHEERMVIAGYWSTYWYNGKIYGTEIIRGLDVFELTPSEHLSENEIAAAKMADMGEVFNPQQQFKITWPNHPVVAMAYIDQLERVQGLSNEHIAQARELLDKASGKIDSGAKDEVLAKRIEDFATELARQVAQSDARLTELADTLQGIAVTLS